jgi:hydroxypyruvate isomerase
MYPMPERRKFLQQIGLGLLVANTPFSLKSSPVTTTTKSIIRQSVCRWTYSKFSLDELCIKAKQIGYQAIDLIGPKEWNVLKQHGMDSSMFNGAEISLTEGWNRPEYHNQLTKNYLEHIEYVHQAGYKNLICFSGNKKGMDDETGLKNCVTGLKKILGEAEKKGVVIQMELFNSKVNHPDYMCDRSSWGIELCKRIDSPNFKLLYDIYHMQISEGDIIRTIQQSHTYFGHYHTAGVPGRHEIDDSQELYYPAIMRAIAATGYTGYVAQEFIPTSQDTTDQLKVLEQAYKICSI